MSILLGVFCQAYAPYAPYAKFAGIPLAGLVPVENQAIVAR